MPFRTSHTYTVALLYECVYVEREHRSEQKPYHIDHTDTAYVPNGLFYVWWGNLFLWKFRHILHKQTVGILCQHTDSQQD
jgi:hypothetical protein